MPLRALLTSFVLFSYQTAWAGFGQADSPNFILDSTGRSPGVSGFGQADSGSLTLDTTGRLPGIGGFGQADSGDFIVDSTGRPPGLGGFGQADSLNFIADTRDTADIGLRANDGTGTIKIACALGTNSPLRISKNGVTYGILLVPTNSPDASKIRIRTSAGLKAWKKLP
jgi:hypothetical protein